MKICRCVCGSPAEISKIKYNGICLVRCLSSVSTVPAGPVCWHGKACEKEDEAIRQWNSVMNVIVGLDIIFGNIDESGEAACDDCVKAGPLRFCDKHTPF